MKPLAIFRDRPTKLFIFFSAFFVANGLLAECIGGKLFSLETFIGLPPANFKLFGETGLSYDLTCGVVLWPLEFVMTDIVNEFYGPKAVKRISYIAVSLIAYAFMVFYIAINLPGSTFWRNSQVNNGVADMQAGFVAVFGQGMWIIAGSLVAFLMSQIVDVLVFHRIKKKTGEKFIWLRATGSTLVSQLVDSFIVLFIAFKLGQGWHWQKVLAVCVLNYSYKVTIAILLTPLIYIIEHYIVRYLGKEKSAEMKKLAAGNGEDGDHTIAAG